MSEYESLWRELMARLNTRYRQVKNYKDNIGYVPLFDEIVVEYVNLLDKCRQQFQNTVASTDIVTINAIINNAEMDLGNKIDELQNKLSEYIWSRWGDLMSRLNTRYKQLKNCKDNIGYVPLFDEIVVEYANLLETYKQQLQYTAAQMFTMNTMVSNAAMDLGNKIYELQNILSDHVWSRWKELTTRLNTFYRQLKNRKDNMGYVPRHDQIVVEYVNLLKTYQEQFLINAGNGDIEAMNAVVNSAEINLENKINELARLLS